LIGRPVLDELGFVARLHLDSVREKFHLNAFSHIGEDLLEIGKEPSGFPSILLLNPADIPKLIEDLPGVTPLEKDRKATLRKRMKASAQEKEGYKTK
jgi:hypothetical protein